MKRIIVLLIAVAILFSGCGQETPTGDVVKTSYIEIKGSDTLLQLVSNMAEEFSEVEPRIKLSVTGGGSGTGIAALINGEIDIADASRQIKDSEIDEAEKKGFTPWEFIIARDMLSVIVNENNDVTDLTMDQLSKIYKGEITNWKELGGDDGKIVLYGRQSTSGTYAFFMEHVVQDDYSATMMNMEGNQAIVDAVKLDKNGIGYVGLGYIVDEKGDQITGVNIVDIAVKDDFISPLDLSRMSDYPISRPLYQYMAAAPKKGSALYKFLMFELSPDGEDIVKDTGFVAATQQDRAHNDALLAKV